MSTILCRYRMAFVFIGTSYILGRVLPCKIPIVRSGSTLQTDSAQLLLC